MRHIQEMKKSFHNEDPISREISLYQKRREQANQIENTLRGIKTLFANTDIMRLKEQLTSKVEFQIPDRNQTSRSQSRGGVYNSEMAVGLYSRLIGNLSKQVVESPEISQNLLIRDEVRDKQKGEVSPFVTPDTKLNQERNVQVRFDATVQKSYPGSSLHSSNSEVDSRHRAATPKREISPPPVTIHHNYMAPQEHDQKHVSWGSPSNATVPPKVKIVDTVPSPTPSFETSELAITPGTKPLATVNPEKTEIQISYPISTTPSMKHVKDIKLGGSAPTTIKALDDRNILVGHTDGTLKVIDTSSPNGHTVRQCRLNSAIKTIESLCDSSGDNPLMEVLCGLASPDNCILKIQLQQRELQTVRYKGHTSTVNQVVVVSKTEFLSCSEDGTVRYWTTANSAPLHTVKVSDQPVTSITTLSSHSTVVAGCRDGGLYVYSFGRNTADRTQSAPVLRNTLMERGPISFISAFYGNAKFVLSVLTTGAAHIWNVEDGECLNEITGHKGTVKAVVKITSLCASPDIYFLLAASEERTFCFGGVDETGVSRTPLLNRDAISVAYHKQGDLVCQILSGKPYEGLRLALMERPAGSTAPEAGTISIWDLQTRYA